MSDAADSPIVCQEGAKNQWVFGVGALYAWYSCAVGVQVATALKRIMTSRGETADIAREVLRGSTPDP